MAKFWIFFKLISLAAAQTYTSPLFIDFSLGLIYRLCVSVPHKWKTWPEHWKMLSVLNIFFLARIWNALTHYLSCNNIHLGKLANTIWCAILWAGNVILIYKIFEQVVFGHSHSLSQISVIHSLILTSTMVCEWRKSGQYCFCEMQRTKNASSWVHMNHSGSSCLVMAT